MSSTPESIPLTRRIHGELAIAVGVLVAIAVAVTLIAVTSPSSPTLSTSASPSHPTPRTSAGTSQANVVPTPQTRYLGPRQAGAVVNGGPGPAAAVGNTASSPTVQANRDQQQVISHNLVRGEALPYSWLGAHARP